MDCSADVHSEDDVPEPLWICEYQSRTKESGGVPMLIVSFQKTDVREADRSYEPARCRLDEREALRLRNERIVKDPASKAARALNLSDASVVAFKAHISRGTYECSSSRVSA